MVYGKKTGERSVGGEGIASEKKKVLSRRKDVVEKGPIV